MTRTAADDMIHALIDMGYREKPAASRNYRVFRKPFDDQLVMVDKRGNIYTGESVSRRMASARMKHLILNHLDTMGATA